jgi:hypothetical protein
MLRLIGALVVLLLLIGPLMANAGLLDNTGILHQFVELETRAFAELLAAIRGMLHRGTP